MTKEEWDNLQNSFKKSYKYVSTGVPGQVKKVKVDDSIEQENEDDKKKKKKQEQGSGEKSISDKPVTKSEKELSEKKVQSPSGVYSAILDEEGKTIKNPTELQAMRAKLKYLKRNFSDQADRPSNVYRPQWEHEAINYDKKKEEAKMNKIKK